MNQSQTQAASTARSVLPGTYLLTITFVVLKALGHLDWSWWWVFAPLWIPWALILLILVVIGIVYLLVLLLDPAEKAKRERRKARRKA